MYKSFMFNNFLLLSVWILLHKTVNSQRNQKLITKFKRHEENSFYWFGTYCHRCIHKL